MFLLFKDKCICRWWIAKGLCPQGPFYMLTLYVYSSALLFTARCRKTTKARTTIIGSTKIQWDLKLFCLEWLRIYWFRKDWIFWSIFSLAGKVSYCFDLMEALEGEIYFFRVNVNICYLPHWAPFSSKLTIFIERLTY